MGKTSFPNSIKFFLRYFIHSFKAWAFAPAAGEEYTKKLKCLRKKQASGRRRRSNGRDRKRFVKRKNLLSRCPATSSWSATPVNENRKIGHFVTFVSHSNVFLPAANVEKSSVWRKVGIASSG